MPRCARCKILHDYRLIKESERYPTTLRQSILAHTTKLTALDEVHVITDVIHKLARSLLIQSTTNTASPNCIGRLTRHTTAIIYTINAYYYLDI